MSSRSLMNQTIVSYAQAGHDKYGRDIAGAGTNWPARFEPKNSTRLTPTGDRVGVDGKVFTVPEFPGKIGDRFSFNGFDYEIIELAPIPGRNGAVHHIEMAVGRWQG